MLLGMPFCIPGRTLSVVADNLAGIPPARIWAGGTRGKHAASLAAARDGLKAQDDTGYGWWDAELHRLEGIALQHALEAALHVAQKQQAKAYELRAAMSMARLWGERGKRTEARDLLAPIYGWFTEGLDTIDLKEAKALLAELA
jgi:predicted ATPase